MYMPHFSVFRYTFHEQVPFWDASVNSTTELLREPRDEAGAGIVGELRREIQGVDHVHVLLEVIGVDLDNRHRAA